MMPYHFDKHEHPLGYYNAFDGRYFNEEYYLINKFGKKVIDFTCSEYFDEGYLLSLNQLLGVFAKHDIDVSVYKKSTTYNAKEASYNIDWYLFLKDEQIIINITHDTVKSLDNAMCSMEYITAIEDIALDEIMRIFELAKTCQVKSHDDKKRYISIVGSSRGGLMMRKYPVKSPNVPNLDLYYGENFEQKSNQLIKLINTKDNSGLFIFHGVTGSGKTNYIRYVISQSRPDIDFIFYPITLLREIASPDLVTFLSDYNNSVLIIEESEDSVQSREKFESDKSSIANLLNISDGLLSDVLNLKIICTFNTDINNLDKALLREGRLLGIHRFDKLKPEQANQIAKENNLEKQFSKPTTLAEIFNKKLKEDLSGLIDSPKIGF